MYAAMDGPKIAAQGESYIHVDLDVSVVCVTSLRLQPSSCSFYGCTEDWKNLTVNCSSFFRWSIPEFDFMAIGVDTPVGLELGCGLISVLAGHIIQE